MFNYIYLHRVSLETYYLFLYTNNGLDLYETFVEPIHRTNHSIRFRFNCPIIFICIVVLETYYLFLHTNDGLDLHGTSVEPTHCANQELGWLPLQKVYGNLKF